MPDPPSVFKSDYSNGSETTSRSSEAEDRSPPVEGASGASQTASVGTAILPPVDQLIEPQRYGTGKPRRVVIRGRISRA